MVLERLIFFMIGSVFGYFIAMKSKNIGNNNQNAIDRIDCINDYFNKLESVLNATYESDIGDPELDKRIKSSILSTVKEWHAENNTKGE